MYHVCVGMGTMIVCGVQRKHICRHECHDHVEFRGQVSIHFRWFVFFQVLFLKVCVCVRVHVLESSSVGSGPTEKVWNLWMKESDT